MLGNESKVESDISGRNVNINSKEDNNDSVKEPKDNKNNEIKVNNK
jgi:hypothetical protein